MNRSFLIIRLSSLGDIIHALPAFASLRLHFPQAKITWAVEPKGKEILDLVPGLDRIAVINWKELRQSVASIRHKDQVALDFQGLVKSAGLAFLSRSRERIGFHRKNLREPLASLFYTKKADPVDERTTHVIAKNLKLLEPLGIEAKKYEFPLVLPEELMATVSSKLNELGFAQNQRLLIYNIGAAWETKRWFPEKWAELVATTRFEDSFPLLLWGNELEKELALSIKKKTDLALSPFLTVQEVMALIKMADLVISGDTFAFQTACAFRIPVVGLFGPTNPQRNGPFEPPAKAIFHKLDCSPCYKRTCQTLDCLRAISVEEVAEAIKELWRSHA